MVLQYWVGECYIKLRRESPTKNTGESEKSLIPRLVVVSGLMLPKNISGKKMLRVGNETYGMPFWSENEGQTFVSLPGDGLAGQHPAEPSCFTLPSAAAFLEPAQPDRQGTLW